MPDVPRFLLAWSASLFGLLIGVDGVILDLVVFFSIGNDFRVVNVKIHVVELHRDTSIVFFCSCS